MHKLENISLNCFLSIGAGAVSGYLLWMPLWVIPMDVGVPVLLPWIKQIDPYLSQRGAGYITEAIVWFFLYLPNTFFVTAMAALLIRFLHQTRCLLYAALSLPILIFAIHWYGIWRVKQAWSNTGATLRTEQIPSAIGFPNTAVLLFLTYTLFAVLLVIFDMWNARVKKSGG